ncbi:hypothetical protein C8Q76DRAFT_694694 [Earliella scabrosa]|nr:hypothetical protein C8Q76DRAFT_694694 [Earliella scabrosa]
MSLAVRDNVVKNNIFALKGDLRLMVTTLEQLLKAHAVNRAMLREAIPTLTNSSLDIQYQLRSSSALNGGGMGELPEIDQRVSLLTQVVEAKYELHEREFQGLPSLAASRRVG